jgi:hypothetical protein
MAPIRMQSSLTEWPEPLRSRDQRPCTCPGFQCLPAIACVPRQAGPECVVEACRRRSANRWVADDARATRLNYDRLKQRISDQDKRSRARVAGASNRGVTKASAHRVAHLASAATVPTTNFVALKVGPSSTSYPTTIELVGRHGGRMRVEVHGEVDLRDLVQAFGSMQP